MCDVSKTFVNISQVARFDYGIQLDLWDTLGEQAPSLSLSSPLDGAKDSRDQALQSKVVIP